MIREEDSFFYFSFHFSHLYFYFIFYLSNTEAEFAKLTEEKVKCDVLADSKGSTVTKLFMGTMTIQAIVMARLIWWDLSWDVMEPVAYLMSFTYMTFGWAYYVLARDDIAEYGTIAGRYIHKQRLKLYEKHNFSIEKYEKLERDILSMKAVLKSYGVVDSKDKEDYPIPVQQAKQQATEEANSVNAENIASAKN